ncbi:MAG TPA: alpha/beta fold hydrolase [Acidimicrobiia bacterium]|nr:alpha/beta fold hydrolase [Acidimicrobiia bacterium]
MRIDFETSDGLTLEGAWSLPEGHAESVVVLCHPDPTQRGTMNAPLMKSLASALSEDLIAVLRFNFRGVGRSEGSHGDGTAEVADVDAAVRSAGGRFPDVPLGVAGWSFGAVVALRWQAETGSTLRYAGIAPPVWFPDHRGRLLPEPEDLAPAERVFVIGDRDQFATVDDLREYTDAIGARLEVLEGSDHFFYFREDRVAGVLAGFF